MDVQNTLGRSSFIAIGLCVVGAAMFGFTVGNAADVPLKPEDAKPLKVGAKAPEVNMISVEGKSTALKQILGGKPSIIVFYRGGWCPYCNVQLADLGKNEARIKAKGYQVIAVSPDMASELKKSLDKNALSYKLYSDSGADAIKAFGVAFKVDDQTVAMYKNNYKIDLEKSAGGQTHHLLPVPSVFVIDAKGTIKYAYSNPDYRVRLKGEELLKAL